MTSRSEALTGSNPWPPAAAVAEVTALSTGDLATTAADSLLASDLFSAQYAHNREIVTDVLRRMMSGSHKADVDEGLATRFVNTVARGDAAAVEISKRILESFGYTVTPPATQVGDNDGQ